jgi:hypothetical protein
MHQASTSAATTIRPMGGVGRDVAEPERAEAPGNEVVPAPTEMRAAPVCDAIIGWVDRWRRWLLGAVITLYLLGFNGVWRPEPDAALYMTIGRNLAEGNGYVYMGKVDGLAYPGLPYLWAGVFNVFGADSLFVPHVIIFLMTAATLALTYAYFRLHTTRPMAVIVSLNCAVAHTLYLCAFQLRNDVPFLLGVMAFFTGYEAVQRRARGAAATGSPVWGLTNPVTPWVLLCAGLLVAVSMRPTMLALVAAIVLATVWSVVRGSVRKRYVAAVLVVVAGAVLAFYMLDPRQTKTGTGQYEQVAMNWLETPARLAGRVLHPRTIETFSRSTMEAMFGHELGMGLNTAVTLTILGIGLWLMKRRPLWLFYLLGTIAMMLVMAGLDVPNEEGETGQLVPRHFIGALPLLMYLWWRVAIWMEKHLPPKWGLVMVVLMTGVAFGPNLVKACETLTRQRLYGYRTAHGTSETNTIEQLGATLREKVGPDATVVVPHKRGRQFVFYSGRRMVEATPVLRYPALKANGPVYVLDQGESSVPDFLNRNRLAAGPVIASAPGRIDWRGRQQKEWSLHPVTKKPGAKPTTRRATAGDTAPAAE